MKTLRLITTYDCPRNCVGCCNKQDPFKPEAVQTWDQNLLDIEMVILSGGEPLMYPFSTLTLAEFIRMEKPDVKLILYTAKVDEPDMIENCLNFFDGITITLHEQADVDDFRKLNFQLLGRRTWLLDNNKSLRLNVFKGVDFSLVNDSLWKIKDNIEWIADCPLPNGEELFKLSHQ